MSGVRRSGEVRRFIASSLQREIPAISPRRFMAEHCALHAERGVAPGRPSSGTQRPVGRAVLPDA